MIEVLKSQPHYINSKWRRQFAALGAEGESFGAELLAQLPAGGAESIAERGLDDHALSVFVGRVGNFQMKVAIAGIQPGKLQESLAYMKELQFAALARSVKSRFRKHGPTQDCSH